MASRGNVLLKVVVADWTHAESVEGWCKMSRENSMTAIQQFNIKSKNSADLALTIQAMKILYEKPFITTFCLVSNDRDFTCLVQELREQDKVVIGMGEKGKSSPEFVNAFSEFLDLNGNTKAPAKKQKPKDVCPIEKERLAELQKIIADLIDTSKGNRAYYCRIANVMKEKHADFIPKKYNVKKVPQLIETCLKHLDLTEYVKKKQVDPKNPNNCNLYLERAQIKSVSSEQ